MQREVKILEKRKAQMEKLYEKMCGKAYKNVVTEVEPTSTNEESNANSNDGSNENSNENSNDTPESYSGLNKYKG